MQKRFTLFLFHILFLGMFSIPAHAGLDQLSSGSREGDNSLQQISCQSDADCDDQDPCTSEICLTQNINDIPIGRCLSSGRRENCEAAENPPPPVDCNDNDPCTLDRLGDDGSCSYVHNNVPECSQGAFTCEEFPGLQCCHFQSDCNDHNPNTIDSCVNMESETGYCQFRRVENPENQPTPPVMETPKTETPPPAVAEPNVETPDPAVTTPTAGPEFIFGSGCALSAFPTGKKSLWILTTPFLVFWMNRKNRKKEGRI